MVSRTIVDWELELEEHRNGGLDKESSLDFGEVYGGEEGVGISGMLMPSFDFEGFGVFSKKTSSRGNCR